eukprot:gene4750-4745_t
MSAAAGAAAAAAAGASAAAAGGGGGVVAVADADSALGLLGDLSRVPACNAQDAVAACADPACDLDRASSLLVDPCVRVKVPPVSSALARSLLQGASATDAKTCDVFYREVSERLGARSAPKGAAMRKTPLWDGFTDARRLIVNPCLAAPPAWEADADNVLAAAFSPFERLYAAATLVAQYGDDEAEWLKPDAQGSDGALAEIALDGCLDPASGWADPRAPALSASCWQPIRAVFNGFRQPAGAIPCVRFLRPRAGDGTLSSIETPGDFVSPARLLGVGGAVVVVPFLHSDVVGGRPPRPEHLAPALVFGPLGAELVKDRRLHAVFQPDACVVACGFAMPQPLDPSADRLAAQLRVAARQTVLAEVEALVGDGPVAGEPKTRFVMGADSPLGHLFPSWVSAQELAREEKANALRRAAQALMPPPPRAAQRQPDAPPPLPPAGRGGVEPPPPVAAGGWGAE